MKKLSHEFLLERQDRLMKQPKLPFCVVLDNIRSLHNVGSIFRTSDGVGVEKIWICGITGCPPNNQIAKTALGAEDRLEWRYEKDIAVLLMKLKADGYQIVALEQTDQSVAHQKFIAQSPVCLIVGNEVDGVSDSAIELCDASIEIEMIGLKNSLNVAVAFGIAAYQIRTSLLNH